MPASPRNFRLEFPPALPISARADEIVQAIQAHPVLILAGETGSGKTTQIPKLCLAAGRGLKGRIACTQPRRVAALSIARRVAEEMGVTFGREVGCKVRFSDQTSADTVIKFLTDGMLLAEVQSDPLLRAYDTIIIDEAHERSLNIDFLLGHLRLLRHKRPELKIVITSATLDTESFSAAFENAPVLQVSGRTFPVEVIYSPLDGLGSDAAEGDEAESRAEALHYIDGAVEAVIRILEESDAGDVLVFLPAERDILEVRDQLEGRVGKRCELVPLYGRLSNADQQRVFAASQRRKVVLATNIAETSLTIPGIRFVVDTGLARISRYAPGSRTRRLPIEPVAQSNAEQRKGRSGRVAEGVCIRLYSEKEYNARPRFAQPEIQRANLADVILRMKAFGLGDIERFPFLNMPAAKSIRAGYALLEELGALKEGGEESRPSLRGRAGGAMLQPPSSAGSASPSSNTHSLTTLGRELARLPVDPTVGRMILQARDEKCVAEVLVIAAGLSIQDPRERPLDKQAQADAAHRRFARADSDFLTLLAIWDAYHDEFERLSQNRLRRFCRDHFLSYTRMREWRDIHQQLLETLRERPDFRLTSVWDFRSGEGQKEGASERAKPERPDDALAFGSPRYRAIHRSILAGLLGNIAHRDEENGGYKATQDRRVSIFPGSVLFARDEPKRKGAADKPAAKKAPPPRWIMAAEIMETSRLYARTVARLDPQWALDLGRHLIKQSYSEPFFQQEGGRVLVKRRTRLYGLELEMKAVGFGRIDPVQSTEIFIREALVNDTLTWPFAFLAHNRAVREQVESLLSRARDRGFLNLDEAVYHFYAERLRPWVDDDGALRGLSAVAELVDYVRTRESADPAFLFMNPEHLRDPSEVALDPEAFPASVPLVNRVLPLQYVYKPGQEEDGVTLEVPVVEFQTLTHAALDWAVPGHLAEKVEHYLRTAPKEVRRLFIPLSEATRTITEALRSRDRLTGRRETLLEALCAHIAERFQVRLTPAFWDDKPLPSHLTLRLRVSDEQGRELATGRDLAVLRPVVEEQLRAVNAAAANDSGGLWARARRRHEKADQNDWTFGTVPARLEIGELAGVPMLAFPTLKPSAAGVSLRLLADEQEAAAVRSEGLAKLLELATRHDLAWLQKDLRRLRELGALPATLASVQELQGDAWQCLRRWLCRPERVRPGPAGEFTEGAFQQAVAALREEAKTAVTQLIDLLREILELRQSLLVHPNAHPACASDLQRLLPARFLRDIPLERLRLFPRYLRAVKARADRWKQSPAKDTERAALLAPYARAAEVLAARGDFEHPFRWLVEEFRVSLFAQELGTLEPVSKAKLDAALAGLGIQISTTNAPVPAGNAPQPPAPKPSQKPPAKPLVAQLQKPDQPLKSLGSLDRLFKRS
ncbi:ATP-dependent RNA helicase HrpA [Nibricoccus sp. IMCC34717]|uniref:ATP-dependent RNA helicase HrpA n=1 Tax=Nibricoccus sp. IMCC34717 TaxID=3034021 RepID=UPI00384F9705